MERSTAGASASGLSPEAASAWIRDQTGTRFDPDAVDAFVELLSRFETPTDYVAASTSSQPEAIG